jgi:class 3 adenylate cyclase/tetratricopeptide (TPR) repeat protein
MATITDANTLLKPYVPRLLVEWLHDDPSSPYRSVDGSLAFVDISGFTTMTERLARKGKIGAEEIADVLDACFTDLLSVAYADGAGLIKWGGDAVLLLFDGPHHAERACRAAVAMRRTLREMGAISTTAGLVRLRMSVGIHSGLFEFFLVGDLHRELVITGPAATHTVEMESTAAAGQILVSRATAELLPARSLGEAKAEGILIRRSPNIGYERAEAVEDIEGLELAASLPLRIREHLQSGLGEPEHRPVAVSFIEISGTDDLLERGGPEVLASALDETIRTVQAACARHDVTFLETDISANGLKVLLAAGVPTTSGDNEGAMLVAVRRILDSGSPLPLKIGVNRGRVFSGDFGPSFRKSYSIKGDAVNLAARVMGKAAVGQILVTEAVTDRTMASFELDPLAPFLVKGKARPVRAFSLGNPIRERVSVVDEAMPLVGRSWELSSLLESLERSLARRGSVVELVGEPGMGKSRLIEELIRHAPRNAVLRAACDAYEASTPYFPIRLLLRDVLGIREGDDPKAAARRLEDRVAANAPHLVPWLPLLGIPLDIDMMMTPETEALDPGFRSDRLIEVVDEFLEWILPTPTLFVFEDAHWMDEASSAIVRRLTERVAESPWMICITRREQTAGFRAQGAADALVISLKPLDPKDVGDLVETATEHAPIPAHRMAELVHRSGGNPLFIRELVEAAKTEGGTEELPETVEEMLTAQIDRLPIRDRDLLRFASVVGASFSPDLVTDILAAEGVPPDDDAWKRLGDFVIGGGDRTLRFRHALVRDAAYEGLPFRRRRRLHARVGERVEREAGDRPEDHAELLSLHFLKAQEYRRAWRYSKIAGERAESKYALVEAGDFYRRALEAARRLPGLDRKDVARMHEALGDARDRVGMYEEAARAYRAARKLVVGDPVHEGELRLKEAWIPERLGRNSDALRSVRRALKVVDGLEDGEAGKLRARLTAWYAAILQGQGNFVRAIDWCRRAMEEAERSGDLDAFAHASSILDWAHVELGELDRATHSARALEIYEQLGDRRSQAVVLNNLGMFRYFEGRWDEALDLYGKAKEAWLKTGDSLNAAMAKVNIAEITSDQGKLEEADTLLREALRTLRAAGWKELIAAATSYLGRVAYRSGRFDEGLELLRTARSQYEEMGAQGELLEVETRIAECLVLQGRASEGLPLADQALQAARTLGGVPPQVPPLFRIRAYALMQLGSVDEARGALEASLAAAQSRKADYELALTGRAFVELAGLTGDLPDESLVVEFAMAMERLGIVEVPPTPLPTSR